MLHVSKIYNRHVELYRNRRVPKIQMFKRLERYLGDYGAFNRKKTRKYVVTESVKIKRMFWVTKYYLIKINMKS